MRLSKRSPEYDVLSLAVADLTTKGFQQEQIADRIAISQPQVSRLLKHAREQGWIVTASRLDKKRISKELLDRMRREFQQHDALAQAIARWTPEGVRSDVRVAEASEAMFSSIAANWVAELMMASGLIGVMYGRTVAQIVEGIGRHFSGSPPVDDVRVIPVCPEPHYLLNVERSARYSSTVLAADLRQYLTGKPQRDMPSLQGVPSYVGRDFKPAEQRAVRKHIDRLPGHRRIFGSTVDSTSGRRAGANGKADEPRLIDEIDTLLTSVGIVGEDESRMGTFLRERLAQEEDITAEQLNQWVFGDIGGALLRRSGIDREGRKVVDAMNAGWLGPTFEDFRSCAERATKNDRPGVIVVATGREKAEMVCASVQCGLVNTLIVNHELAAGLEDLPAKGVLPKELTRA